MSLLSDQLFFVHGLAKDRASLPGLLARMSAGGAATFPRLRPHQRPAWHMFLAQLAALALWREGQSDLPADDAVWVDLLRRLTPDHSDDAPWCLGAPDDRPAFLQPPDPGGLKWSPVPTPDALDMLITSRNHDLKSAIGTSAEAEDWIYALVSLQTMEGYGGAGNHGIARMNGGSSSRMCMGLAPAGQGADMTPRWQRDVRRMLELRAKGAWDDGPCARQGGHALLWCRPWPEGAVLGPTDIDPWAIEVCRRVRLSLDGGQIMAMRATSKAARIDAKALKGALGDPWAPTHVAQVKAFTISERDLDYTLLYTLIGPDFVPPLLAKPGPSDPPDLDLELVAEVIARGNSKTFGFKTRRVPVPSRAAGFFGTQTLGDHAKAMNETDLASADKALGGALALLAAGGDRAKRSRDDWGHAVTARADFRRGVDAIFFPALWDRLQAGLTERDDEVASRKAFVDEVDDLARAAFRRARPSVPCPAIWRAKAEARAEAEFNRILAQPRNART